MNDHITTPSAPAIAEPYVIRARGWREAEDTVDRLDRERMSFVAEVWIAGRFAYGVTKRGR